MTNKFTLFGIILIIVAAAALWRLPTWTTPCANPGTCTSLPTENIDNDSIAVYGGTEIIPPTIALQDESLSILGDEDGVGLPAQAGEKHIYVDLEEQKLSAYQGNDLYLTAFVSTGKWNKTPPGDYKIWSKFRATRMSGGSGADYYNLPNVPYVMFFSNSKIPPIAGYSLHGAYWHNNFGHPMSHGCVNMREVDARDVFNWAEIGTQITIY